MNRRSEVDSLLANDPADGSCSVGVRGIHYLINAGEQSLAEEKKKADYLSKMAYLNPSGDVNIKTLWYFSNCNVPFKYKLSVTQK